MAFYPIPDDPDFQPITGQQEPTFTPEEAELHSAPWSYLSPSDMTAPTNRPLWELMHDAFITVGLSGPRGHRGFAAEIRAIAKAMAEAEQRGEFTSKGLYGCLLAEADRAEAGE
jgi:hypothetical protein